MDIKTLDAKYHVNSENGFLLRYVRSDTEYFRPHNHNYYEIFMVIKGQVRHIINEREQILCEGSILFIRDTDVHDYMNVNNEYFEFINISVSRELAEAVFDYLGEDFPKSRLFRGDEPPKAVLTPKEKERLFFALTELDQNNAPLARLKIKKLLVEIFMDVFMESRERVSDVPLWLEELCEKMKNPKNFIAGVQKMYKLSGKSREHLTRCMKKYYGTTPTGLVTELRLDYCAGLLGSSNLPIVDICYTCGFENLSWFYKQFKNKFGETPMEYRKKTGRL